jgi:hypothetical protein
MTISLAVRATMIVVALAELIGKLTSRMHTTKNAVCRDMRILMLWLRLVIKDWQMSENDKRRNRCPLIDGSLFPRE